MYCTQGVNFFKYITPTACTDRLKIPLAHSWNKNSVFPDEVILKDKNGNTWPVKVQKVGNQVCFVGAGWLKFVKDNRVEPEYFLTLLNDDDGPNTTTKTTTNNNNVVFSFLLLDSVTKCETGGFVAGPSDILPSLQPSPSYFFPEDSSAMEEEECKSDESMNEFDDDDDEKEDDDDDRDEESPTDPCRGNTSSARPQKERTTDEGTKKKSKDIYGEEIFRSGVIPRPMNPYFVFYIRKNRPNELHVPLNVIKDYRLYLPKKAMIRDPQGVEWETELVQWEDGRVLYRGGWLVSNV